VRVIVSHFGNTDDELDRKWQKDGLVKLVKQRPGFKPTIFIGYLTTAPYSPHYIDIIQSGLRDTDTNLDRYCLYVLYKNLQYLNLERIDKGDTSDTEVQIGTFRLTPEKKSHHEGTQEWCSKFLNPIKCQQEPNCGWCQFDTVGSCYSPEEHPACKLLHGNWVGPINETQIPTNNQTSVISKFVKLQFQQLQSVYGMESTENTFVWRASQLHEVAFGVRRIQSPWFECKGNTWRVSLVIRGVHRGISMYVERGYPSSALRLNIAISILHPKNSDSIHQSFNGNFIDESQVNGVQIGSSLSDLRNSNFLVDDSVNIGVSFP